MYKSTGQRLKEVREDKDLTQKDLANILEINPNQLGKYERDEQQMTIRIFRKMVITLQVSSDYILDIPKGLYDPR